MEQSPSWEASGFSANQVIPRILWNPKVHYHIHKCPPPVPILSQLHPVHTAKFHFLKIHLNIILPSTFGSVKWSFSQVSPPKPCIRLSHPYALHAPPISFFSILSPEQYWVSGTDPPGSYADRIARCAVGKPKKAVQILLAFAEPVSLYLKTEVAGWVLCCRALLCSVRRRLCVACSRNTLVSGGFDTPRCGKSLLYADRFTFQLYRVTQLSYRKRTSKCATWWWRQEIVGVTTFLSDY